MGDSVDHKNSQRLPLLVQLIHGTYQDKKEKEGKRLAHEGGHGASCSNCGTECSGFDLHFWRKVCKNCGCRPEAHDISLNKDVHEEILRDLFKDSNVRSKISESSTDEDLAGQNVEEQFRERSTETAPAIPEIRIESMNLDDSQSKQPEPMTEKTENERKLQKTVITSYCTQEPKKVELASEEKSGGQSNESGIPGSSVKDDDSKVNNRPHVSLESKISRPSDELKGEQDSKDLNTNQTSKEEGGIPVPPPRKESFHGVKRQRQLLSQLPPQDFDPKFCSTLNRKQKQAMNKMKDIEKQAAGKGKLIKEDTNRKVCKGCSSEIATGEEAVSSTHEKELLYWHQDCFKCNSCQEKIADYIYFWHEGSIYCGRHFAERYRPRCAACDELIYADKYTEAEGKIWHMEHFTCFICDKNLADTNYISHKGQPHCMSCYHFKIASKCASCMLPIQVGEARISHENMHWHAYPECFFCRNCNKDLVDAGFLLKDNKIFCSSKCSRNDLS